MKSSYTEFKLAQANPSSVVPLHLGQGQPGGKPYFIVKRGFDILWSVLLLPVLLTAVLILMLVNPFLNPGPLFFMQIRMGQDRRAFALFKFRSMVNEDVKRAFDDPLETSRVTGLGAFLRRSRIDELPQIINVLKGDMSLIGPRPDMFSHAKTFCRLVPGYRNRHSVRPGISGLAQVYQGYAEGLEDTVEKARLDLVYIEKAGFRLDTIIFLKTLKTVFTALGK